MTDLDELFRPLIDESASRRAPVDEIETRAGAYRSRERRRHRTQGFAAGAVVIALVAGAVALVGVGHDESVPPAHSSPTTTTPTPTVRIPAGWQTYDYGLARLSIPPGWKATTGCPSAHGLLMDDPSLDTVRNCPQPLGGPSIAISLYANPYKLPFIASGEVNGFRYSLTMPKCRCNIDSIVKIPALNIALTFSGDIRSDRILQTLTYSTYARVLQQPFGPGPSSWKTITFDGYSVRVPREWKTVPNSVYCRPQPNTAYYSNVASTAGGCDFDATTRQPEDSVQLFGGNAMAAAKLGSHRGLSFGRLDAPGPFVHTLAFIVTGGTRPLVVTVGLGLDPAIARGILGSLQRAG